VGLAEAIGAVRSELTAAMDAGAGERIRFTAEPIELELGVEVRTGGRAEGGVKIGVVSIGASGERSSTASHRLTVRLQPVEVATGHSPLIGDDESPAPRRTPSTSDDGEAVPRRTPLIGDDESPAPRHTPSTGDDGEAAPRRTPLIGDDE
jgi:hypothetical protein